MAKVTRDRDDFETIQNKIPPVSYFYFFLFLEKKQDDVNRAAAVSVPAAYLGRRHLTNRPTFLSW